MTVLVLARNFDPTADAVVRELGERDVPVFRTDLGEFPTQLMMSADFDGTWHGALWNEHHHVRFEDIHAIWNRNPASYSFPSSMTAAEQDFAYREAKLGFGGLLAALDAMWVNHPHRCANAIHKPYQWKIAADCGLATAPTLITNDPDSARRFAQRRRSIVKALGPTGLVEDGDSRVSFTHLLTDDDLADLRGVAATATTVQEFVSKAHEVRLTVIGERWFPIAIHAASEDGYLDWRSDPSSLHYEFTTMPDHVMDGVHAYMKRTGLVVAGWDFAVTPDGEWTMLEANTGPQIGWLEAATGAPMVAALADTLEGTR